MTISGSLLGSALLPPAWAAAKYWKTPSGHGATDLSVNDDMSVWGVVTGGGWPYVQNTYVWREGAWFTLPVKGTLCQVSLDGNTAVVHVPDDKVYYLGPSSLYRFEWDGVTYAQVAHVPSVPADPAAVGSVTRKPLRGSADCKLAIRIDGANLGIYEWDGTAYAKVADVSPSDGVAATPKAMAEFSLSGDGKVLVGVIQREYSTYYSSYVKRWSIADDGSVTYAGHLYYTGSPAMSATDGDTWLYGGLAVNFDGSIVIGGLPRSQNLLGRVALFRWDGSKYVTAHDRYPSQGANTTGMGNAVAVTASGAVCFSGASMAGKGGVFRHDKLRDPTQDYWYWPYGGYGYDGAWADKPATVAFGTAVACTPDGKSFIASGADEILPKWA